MHSDPLCWIQGPLSSGGGLELRVGVIIRERMRELVLPYFRGRKYRLRSVLDGIGGRRSLRA